MRSLAALLMLFIAACAPRLQPLEPANATPILGGDRMTMDDGAELPLRVWAPTGSPRAAFLALHGFNDYSLSFEEPAKHWAAAGIVTYAFDQRGFGDTAYRGLWPGEVRMIEDLRIAAALIRQRHAGIPLYLVGESMGGAVIMAAATSGDPPAAAGLILAAPAIWGRDAQGPVKSGALWLFAHTMPWLTLTGEGLKVQPSDNLEMLRRLARDPKVIKETRVDAIWGLTNMMDLAYDAAPRLPAPALLLYGSQEDVLPDDAVLAMLRRLPTEADRRPRVALYAAGYHMLLRDLSAAVVLDDIIAWVADRSAPLPSGGDVRAEAAMTGGGDSLATSAVTD
ncbi:MAG: alpha/beta fold hydrolase [Dongiaceae bacterium]